MLVRTWRHISCGHTFNIGGCHPVSSFDEWCGREAACGRVAAAKRRDGNRPTKGVHVHRWSGLYYQTLKTSSFRKQATGHLSPPSTPMNRQLGTASRLRRIRVEENELSLGNASPGRKGSRRHRLVYPRAAPTVTAPRRQRIFPM